MNLQLLAQGSDGLFQKALLVACGAPELLYFGGVRFDQVLHLLALGPDGHDVLLNFVKCIGGGLLEGALLFALNAFELVPHGGNRVAQLGCFERGFLVRVLDTLFFLRPEKIKSGAHFGDGGPQVSNLLLGLQKCVELGFTRHATPDCQG